jgi:hypothetical protein
MNGNATLGKENRMKNDRDLEAARVYEEYLGRAIADPFTRILLVFAKVQLRHRFAVSGGRRHAQLGSSQRTRTKVFLPGSRWDMVFDRPGRDADI